MSQTIYRLDIANQAENKPNHKLNKFHKIKFKPKPN